MRSPSPHRSQRIPFSHSPFCCAFKHPPPAPPPSSRRKLSHAFGDLIFAAAAQGAFLAHRGFMARERPGSHGVITVTVPARYHGQGGARD